MKKYVLFVCFYLIYNLLFAQTNPVLLAKEQWIFKPDKVVFTQEKGKSAMKIMPDAGKVVANNLDFSDGTIEFDVKPNSLTFYFRYQDAEENECFYFRMGLAGNPTAPEAVQYAPVVDSVLMWDIYPHYQSNATFVKGDWNHVKLVISGAQMRIYVNQQDQPTLEVGQLAGNPERGTLAFEGDMTVTNLIVTPGKTETLSPLAGIDPTGNDPRYIRHWAVSDPITIPEKIDFSDDLLPTPDTPWRVLETEHRGLVNLTRTFGSNDARSIIWLKVKIESATAQSKTVNFGFVDDVWVFLNGQLIYLDKNLQGRLMEKAPGGRCSIDNTSFVLPLKEGVNELLMGLAHDAFWGRGTVARLEDIKDIKITPDPTFDSRLVELAPEIVNTYVGVYVLPSGTKVQVARENEALVLSGESFVTIRLYPRAENRFFSRESDMEIAFIQDSQDKISKFELYNKNKRLMDVKRVE